MQQYLFKFSMFLVMAFFQGTQSLYAMPGGDKNSKKKASSFLKKVSRKEKQPQESVNFKKAIDQLEALRRIEKYGKDDEGLELQLSGLKLDDGEVAKIFDELLKNKKYLAVLKRLKKLNLSGNDLTRLPSDIGLMTELVSLDLSHNRISQLPAQIYALKKLDSLNTEENPLKTRPFHLNDMMKNKNSRGEFQDSLSGNDPKTLNLLPGNILRQHLAPYLPTCDIMSLRLVNKKNLVDLSRAIGSQSLLPSSREDIVLSAALASQKSKGAESSLHKQLRNNFYQELDRFAQQRLKEINRAKFNKKGKTAQKNDLLQTLVLATYFYHTGAADKYYQYPYEWLEESGFLDVKHPTRGHSHLAYKRATSQILSLILESMNISVAKEYLDRNKGILPKALADLNRTTLTKVEKFPTKDHSGGAITTDELSRYSILELDYLSKFNGEKRWIIEQIEKIKSTDKFKKSHIQEQSIRLRHKTMAHTLKLNNYKEYMELGEEPQKVIKSHLEPLREIVKKVFPSSEV